MQPFAEHQINPAQLPFGSGFEARAVSPTRAMGAYAVLWCDPQATFKSLSRRFAQHPGSITSDLVPPKDVLASAAFVKQPFAASSIARFGVCVNGAGEYPDKLRDAAHPIELLYYQGWRHV